MITSGTCYSVSFLLIIPRNTVYTTIMSAASPEKYNTLVRPQVITCMSQLVFIIFRIRESLLLTTPLLSSEGLPTDLTLA